MLIKSKKGQTEVEVLLAKIDLVVKGCDEALAKGPNPDLSALRSKAQSAHHTYSEAVTRKKTAIVELGNARQGLDVAFGDATDRYRELCAHLRAVFGFRSAKLGGFGMSPLPPRGKTRPKKATSTPAKST